MNGPLAQASPDEDPARRAFMIKHHIDVLQDCVSSIERCRKRMWLRAPCIELEPQVS